MIRRIVLVECNGSTHELEVVEMGEEVQVADDISEPKTLSRELEPLGKIRDSYPKLLIARTRHDETDRDGVRIIDIARWLEG